jgi:hypothetical protein
MNAFFPFLCFALSLLLFTLWVYNARQVEVPVSENAQYAILACSGSAALAGVISMLVSLRHWNVEKPALESKN